MFTIKLRFSFGGISRKPGKLPTTQRKFLECRPPKGLEALRDKNARTEI